MMLQGLYKTIFMASMIIALSNICNAGSHETLFDPEHGCILQSSCYRDRCAVQLNEYSLAAFNNLKHEHRKINWEEVEAQNEKIEIEAGEAVANGADVDFDEAELNSIMVRQAVRCPQRGHHVSCLSDATCIRYHPDAYCVITTVTVKNQYGENITLRNGRCYLDVYNPRQHQMHHYSNFQ